MKQALTPGCGEATQQAKAGRCFLVLLIRIPPLNFLRCENKQCPVRADKRRGPAAWQRPATPPTGSPRRQTRREARPGLTAGTALSPRAMENLEVRRDIEIVFPRSIYSILIRIDGFGEHSWNFSRMLLYFLRGVSRQRAEVAPRRQDLTPAQQIQGRERRIIVRELALLENK